ncbi:hypothetical protein AYL99_09525 [Fonsecaea erecta]|uniref:Beta-xylosidase C-terminal Concanavalin A-like domain-containing protein n=1 Tax=Fonsecaea erecta TaxID=1367422 RepID=A0A178ZA39_9EURO|nr:hypothetical protein AYL99_09525 [Fonsecaea erecta]OAP56346.1 hypothetical protein AYL99_09525 [Fonsecaea erecta]
MSEPHVNPIIPGFAPDPSVVLIDGTFFLVNSSFHVFPGLPIYASKDLISWKQIGNAINRQSQLSLTRSRTNLVDLKDLGEVMLATGGLYAPTIRRYGGIVYILCTNVIHDDDPSMDNLKQNFIVTTDDIWSNKWSDPIYFEFDGIDPSLFFDDDGRSYIQGSASPGPMTKINQFEVDLQTGKKLSEERKIWDGNGDIYPEGPHLYKKDGWYYLMISEGGTHENHMITVARSKHIWGPYESFSGNPILTARGTNEYIRYTGHCDVFQDQQGQWWGVCLGVRKADGRFIMGRETFLTSAAWPEGEWPSLSQVKLDPKLPNGEEMVRPEGSRAVTAAPMVDYVYIRDADLQKHQFSADGNNITLTSSPDDISQYPKPVTFVGKRQRLLSGTSLVTMHKPGAQGKLDAKAGLVCYQDEHRYARIFYDFAESLLVFEIVNNAKSLARTSKRSFQLGESVSLRIEYTETTYRFSFRDEQLSTDFSVLESLDTLDLTGPDFVGPIMGIFAVGAGQDFQVQFSGLQVD